MLTATIRRPVARVTSILGNRRGFSLTSVHSSFPATLYRFQLSRESQLYDQKLQKEDSEVGDAVSVSQDGLVYPEVQDWTSNGAPFMPNTYISQKLTRMSFVYYLDNQADSLPSADPLFLRIPKDLNSALTEFYSTYGTRTPAEKWLEEHKYHKCHDDAEDDWMHH